MTIGSIRRRPWTCRFGRCGVTIEQVGPDSSRVDGVFWACHRAGATPPIKVTTPGECARCPWWEASSHVEREH